MPQIYLGFLLIGWERGRSFINQSQSMVMQNQSDLNTSFSLDTQFKPAFN